MTKSNLQIRIPPELDLEISQIAVGSKSAFVREAIEEKIRLEKARRLEREWVQALTKHPEDSKDSEDWLKAEAWGTR